MAKAKVINNINHDGTIYTKGDTFEGDKEVVEQLIAAGALGDANEPKDDQSVDSAVSDAEVKAKEIVAEAEKALNEAKAEAEKVIADAKAEAEKTAETAKAEAEKVIADAKAEAEKTKKAAQSK